MAVIGIHTRIPQRPTEDEALGASHAWITLAKDGDIRSFSLDSFRSDRVQNSDQLMGRDGSGKTDVREGLDHGEPTASLYKHLTLEQENKFNEKLEAQSIYRLHGNNCTHWAKDVWQHTTGVELNAEHIRSRADLQGGVISVTSPIGLEKSIRERQLDLATENKQVQPPQSWPVCMPAPDQMNDRDKPPNAAKQFLGAANSLFQSRDDPADNIMARGRELAKQQQPDRDRQRHRSRERD